MPVPAAGGGTFWAVVGADPGRRVAVGRCPGTPLSPGWAPVPEGCVPGGAMVGGTVLCGVAVSVWCRATMPPGWDPP